MASFLIYTHAHACTCTHTKREHTHSHTHARTHALTHTDTNLRPKGDIDGGRDRGDTEIAWKEAGVSAPAMLWAVEQERGHFWPPWVGDSHCYSLLTNDFQSWFKSFTHFNIPAARVFFIHSHPYRLSFPQIGKSNLSWLRYVFRLGTTIFFKKYKPNGINFYQLFNCNQDVFINDVNIFTAFL